MCGLDRWHYLILIVHNNMLVDLATKVAPILRQPESLGEVKCFEVLFLFHVFLHV